MARKPKVEKVEEAEEQTSAKTEYDLYKAYQDYFEGQQKQVMNYWTTVMNNMFWWTKK